MRVIVAFIVFLVCGTGCVPSLVLDKPYSDLAPPSIESEETMVVLFKNDQDLIYNPKEKWDISVNGEKVATIFEETHTIFKLGIGNHTIRASKRNIFANSSVGKFLWGLVGTQKNTIEPSLELEIDNLGAVEYVRFSLQSKTSLEGMEVFGSVAVGRFSTSRDATLRRIDKEKASALLKKTRSIRFTKKRLD